MSLWLVASLKSFIWYSSAYDVLLLALLKAELHSMDLLERISDRTPDKFLIIVAEGVMFIAKEPLSFFVSDLMVGLFVWITICGFCKSCFNAAASDFRMLGSFKFMGCFRYDCYRGCLVSLLFERVSGGFGMLTQQPPLPVCFAWKMLPGSDCLTARRSKIRSEDLAVRFFFILIFSASFLLWLNLKQF